MSLLLYFLIPISAGIAFLFSLASFLQRPVPLYLRLFPFYLLLDCMMEVLADYKAMKIENNLLLSSLSALFAFCFYIYVVRGFVQRQKARRILSYFLIIIPLVFAINIFLVQKSSVFQSMTNSLGSLLVVAACIYYFWELFQQSTYIKLGREPAFWICSGLLFYYACSFPIYGLINFITTEIGMIKVLAIILDSVNIFLYLSFIIAFLCRLKIKKSLLSS